MCLRPFLVSFSSCYKIEWHISRECSNRATSGSAEQLHEKKRVVFFTYGYVFFGYGWSLLLTVVCLGLSCLRLGFFSLRLGLFYLRFFWFRGNGLGLFCLRLGLLALRFASPRNTNISSGLFFLRNRRRQPPERDSQAPSETGLPSTVIKRCFHTGVREVLPTTVKDGTPHRCQSGTPNHPQRRTLWRGGI